MSRRRNQPFVPAAVAEFRIICSRTNFAGMRARRTHAYGEQKGLAALAEVGTLFLDEVD
jgi:DNA-binding NtrC family response regulator